MKKIICLSFIGFLLQSCAAYNPVYDETGLQENQYYKVWLHGKVIKGQLIEIRTTTLIVQHRRQKYTVVTPDIRKIKSREIFTYSEFVNFPKDFVALLCSIPFM